MLLHVLSDASASVAATRSRLAKVAVLAEVLQQASADELPVIAHWLGGTLRQRRTGVGWRSVRPLPEPAETPSLGVLETDAVLSALGAAAGPGSQSLRARLLGELLARATASEQRYLAGLLTGEVRQGALDGLVLDAVAQASGLPGASVRRAAMLAGGTAEIVVAALTGGASALAAFDVQVGRPIRPMLAASAPSLAEAMAKASADAPVAIEAKLDGIRIQVHSGADGVRVFTRSLDDVTHRLPDIVAAAGEVQAESFVLDGEALALDADGRPQLFQDSASRAASGGGGLQPWFFDVLFLDGVPTLDLPLAERAALLATRVPERQRVPSLVTADPVAAEEFTRAVLASGHEGVVVKDLASPYDAGRRGASWVKVKPVHTLDLVVLAVEWGSGRRQGLLSNLHLGARDGAGGFVMLGKTFKGLTDEMLAWQTERFLALETHRDAHVVHVRPEQVVEIAIDGLQRSRRYPGGVALRFARVVRYRDDKTAAEAETLAGVLTLARSSAEGDVGDA